MAKLRYKKVEYQVNGHDEHGDVIDCDHADTEADAREMFTTWLARIGTDGIMSVSVERVTSRYYDGDIPDVEYDVILNSDEE